MNYIKLFEDFTFSDLFDKNKWVELSMEDRSKLKKEIWEIVDLAYKPLGGHVRISSPDAVVSDPDLTFWTAVDIDKDPHVDVVIFSRESYGHKISGWGHDGTKESRKELMKQLITLLHREGFWIEVSGRPAEILIGADCRYSDKQTVSKVFPHSEINWIGDGVYTRTLPDGTQTEEEYLVGRPRV
jgi:hypothetical protein